MESFWNIGNETRHWSRGIMGPYSEIKQLERAEAVKAVLARPNLSDWAKFFWAKVLRDLCFDEDLYNRRVRETYRKENFRPMGTPPWQTLR